MNLTTKEKSVITAALHLLITKVTLHKDTKTFDYQKIPLDRRITKTHKLIKKINRA